MCEPDSPSNPVGSTSYPDYQGDKAALQPVTTAILEGHTDEVWNIEWSHDGTRLASASKDRTAIIWRVTPGTELPGQEWSLHLILRDHPYPVSCLAWSPDDAILVSSAEHVIKLWNTQTGLCIRALDSHSETVTALAWLPDNSGFISGGLDRKIIKWDADGKLTWDSTAIRVTDLAVTPDLTRLVVIGLHYVPPEAAAPPSTGNRNGMIIYDLAAREPESSAAFDGELTSVTVSQNSQYALINHVPEILLWDLNAGRLERKYTGHYQGRHVIRSCFGGVEGKFILSGSEDGKVYVWHRDTGAVLGLLSGHGRGSVNSVAWCPTNEQKFASCSDDHTIRIWGASL